MDFAQQQRNPAKHLVGITFVIIFHALLIYALVNGLAQRVVDVIKKPVEVKIVEEVKPPPPPPQNLPPPPKLAAPPPPFIPPPEVPISAPPPQLAVNNTPPPAAVPFQQAAAAPTAPAAAPPSKSVRAACPNSGTITAEFPPRALQRGISEGKADIRFTLKANGEITDIVVSATNHIFDGVAVAAVKQLKCSPQGADQVFTWGIDFSSN